MRQYWTAADSAILAADAYHRRRVHRSDTKLRGGRTTFRHGRSPKSRSLSEVGARDCPKDRTVMSNTSSSPASSTPWAESENTNLFQAVFSSTSAVVAPVAKALAAREGSSLASSLSREGSPNRTWVPPVPSILSAQCLVRASLDRTIGKVSGLIVARQID